MIIVGDGEYRSVLEALALSLGITDKVVFAGTVDYSQLGPYFTIANVFVNATIRENGYDLTIVQAMGYQKPLIVTQLKALEGVIDDGKNGLLVRKDDVSDLVGKLKMVLDRPDESRIMAQHAYDSFTHYFTADQMVDNTVDVYRQTIASLPGENS